MLTAVASLIARAHARKNRCRGEHWSIVRVYEYPARAGMHRCNSGWTTSNISTGNRLRETLPVGTQL